MISKDMTIEEVIAKYPDANNVFIKYGLDCIGCQVAEFETIGHAARVYGINLDELVKDLNDMEKKYKE